MTALEAAESEPRLKPLINNRHINMHAVSVTQDGARTNLDWLSHHMGMRRLTLASMRSSLPLLIKPTADPTGRCTWRASSWLALCE